MTEPVGMTDRRDGVDEAVQATAFVAAAARAAETRRARPRLRDPLAQRFVEAWGTDAAGRALVANGGDEVVERTVLIDRMLATAIEAAAAEAPPVVVNIGAGFCTRPYRLDLSTAALVLELDAPGVLARKEQLLADAAASCPVRRQPLDLRDGDALRRALTAAIPAGPIIVVTEGVLVYLPEPQVRALANGLAATARYWLADVISTGSARGMNVVATGARAGVTLHGLDSLTAIESAGWTTRDYRPLPTGRGPGFGAYRPGYGGYGGRPGGYGAASAAPASSRRVVDGVALFTAAGLASVTDRDPGQG